MATPSAKDMLMQVQRYADGGDVQSEGLTLALARGLTQEQYDQNIREYASKKTNQLEALNAMSAYGISMADANRALGAQTVRDYFTVDPNIGEAAPSSVVQTNFTSPLQQAFLSTPDKGQAVLDARIREVAAQNVGNPEALRELFLQNDASIADIQRAGVDPSILYSTLARTPKPVPPVIPTQPVIPTVPNVPYTPTSVYQPYAEPTPIYAAGQPALDVPFRNSAPRTYDPRYGYVYTPAASLRPATGAGMSFTPPSVTSRPRSLLNVDLPVDTGKPYSTLTPAEKANLRLSASQYYARDRAAAQQLAALPGGRFSGMTAPAAPAIGAEGVATKDLRFYNGPTQTAAGLGTPPTGGGLMNSGALKLDQFGNPLPFAAGGSVKKSEGTADPSARAMLTAQMDRIGATPNTKTPDPAPTREQTESRNMLGRLAAASAVDQEVYETTGMEPGLDRAAILPFAGTREQGNLQFAAPQMLYDLAKTAVAPGVAASGRRVSNEDALNTALNIAGGSFGASSIAGPVGENILGMAVKPRGGVFRPTVTEDTVRAPSGIDTLIDGYRQALVREGTVPTEQINDIVAKARRYFTTAYGTAKDPLRLAILEGTLNPTVRASGFSGGRPRFRDYLLEAARRDYTAEQGVAAQVDAGTLAAEAPLRTSQSLEDFERLYDEGTGLRGTVYREEGDITPDWSDVLSAVRDQLEGEGVPEERVNPNINSQTPTGGLRDAVDYPSIYGRDAPFYRTLIAGTDPTLKMAMEKGDPVYDIGGTDLDFLNPSNIATGIGGLPLTSLSGMTFPQMAVKGAKIAALRGDFYAVVDRATAGKPIPKTFLLENGVKKITDAGDSTWFRITDPMYTELEGAMMGHSVGGYSRTGPYGLGKEIEGGGKAAFNSGLAQVYSLRNSQTGKPSITVEMTGIGDGPLRITEIYGYKNGVPSPDEWDSVFKLAKEQRVDPSDMLENRRYGRDSNGEMLPIVFPVPWRQLYNGYLRAADEAPTKKAKGGSVERVYNDRKYI